jgi:hypothetical protein
MSFRFSRYLYEVDEVKIALMTSMLDKRRDEALFWAFELYHSGFGKELSEYLTTLYYDFYATLNPKFEKHVIQPLTLTETSLYEIVINMVTKKHSVDIFMLRTIVARFEIEPSTSTSDILSFASFVLEDKDTSLVYDTLEKLKIPGLDFKQSRLLMLVRFIQFKQQDADQATEKKRTLFVKCIEGSNVKRLDIPIDNLPAYRVLGAVTKYGIDEHDYLSLFNLKRDKADIVIAYREKWLLHASSSPVWASRIKEYGGSVTESGIVFGDDEKEEDFFNKYNLEPDEQKIEVQQKTTQIIKSERKWTTFCREHNTMGMVAFDSDILDELIKV